MANSPVTASFDPYQIIIDLPIKAVFYPLGFPLEFSTNSALILEAATLSWGRFPAAFDQRPLRLRVAVEESLQIETPPPPAFRANAGIMAIVADAANFAICDVDRNFAFAFVTSHVARNPAYLCYHFLEAIAFCTLTHRYLAPVHAGVVARQGRGVLLCGPSGAGKSSLSYACARAGWTYISDNAAFLLRGSTQRTVLGDPHAVRLRADAPLLFPELNGRPAANQANGKLAIVLETFRLQTAFACSAECLVFLNRNGEGSDGCSPLPRDEVFFRLQDSMPRYEDAAQQEVMNTLRDLAGVPAFEMRYRELASGVRQIEGLLGGS